MVLQTCTPVIHETATDFYPSSVGVLIHAAFLSTPSQRTSHVSRCQWELSYHSWLYTFNDWINLLSTCLPLFLSSLAGLCICTHTLLVLDTNTAASGDCCSPLLGSQSRGTATSYDTTCFILFLWLTLLSSVYIIKISTKTTYISTAQLP